MIRTTMMERWRIGQANWLQLGANVALAGVWLVLYRPVFDYLATVFTREDFRTNQLVLIGILVLIALQMRGSAVRPRLDAAPQLRWPAFLLALGASAGFVAAERFLDVNSLSATLFGLATYGLLGLWMQPARWRSGLPAALLLIGVLPFGDHLQTFVGYPMRIATAGIVRDGLAAAGVHSVGVDTILVFENGISQVDVPCSGVKSLWTGMLFLLAATWIQRKPINARWLLVAAIFAGMLFVVNLARVAVLVTVGQVAGLQLAAEMLHVPLGVLGFGAACAAAVFLLNHLVGDANRADSHLAKNEQTGKSWLVDANTDCSHRPDGGGLHAAAAGCRQPIAGHLAISSRVGDPTAAVDTQRARLADGRRRGVGRALAVRVARAERVDDRGHQPHLARASPAGALFRGLRPDAGRLAHASGERRVSAALCFPGRRQMMAVC